MLKRFWERRKDEEGFTLIELMVVVLIIGILVAIALPTFLGARGRAQDRAAQSDLRNGMAAAKVFFTDNEVYTGFTAVVAEGIEPSLTWVDGATTILGSVSILDNANDILLQTDSASGNAYCITDTTSPAASAGTDFGSNTTSGNFANVAACNGAPAW